MAIFLLICTLCKTKRKVLIWSSFLFLIHSSFIIFWFSFFFIEFILSKKFNNSKTILILIVFGVILAFITGPFISEILNFIGDRRADLYSGNLWQTSFLTSLYCLCFVAIIYMNYWFKNDKKVDFELSVSVVFFSMVAVSPIFLGGYPFRFLSAVFPIVILSFSHLKNKYQLAAYLMLSIIGIYMGFVQLGWNSIWGEIF
ncbi:hypothetical protein HUN35_08765 [Acinetobacter bereziniae]|nr:hypothetical protein [Acinetobacter bereziniae]